MTDAAVLLASLLVAALAGCQAVETWHHGSLFRGVRSWLWTVRNDEKRWWLARKSAELLTCPFCLSHWTCAAAVVAMFLTDWDSSWRLPVYGLAAVRLAQLLNDISHPLTRSPSDETEIDQTADVDEFSVVDD